MSNRSLSSKRGDYNRFRACELLVVYSLAFHAPTTLSFQLLYLHLLIRHNSILQMYFKQCRAKEQKTGFKPVDSGAFCTMIYRAQNDD